MEGTYCHLVYRKSHQFPRVRIADNTPMRPAFKIPRRVLECRRELLSLDIYRKLQISTDGKLDKSSNTKELWNIQKILAVT